MRDLLVNLHMVWNPPNLRVPAEVYMTDWPVEVLARTLFLESDVDMAANMYLRLDFVVQRWSVFAGKKPRGCPALAGSVFFVRGGQPD